LFLNKFIEQFYNDIRIIIKNNVNVIFLKDGKACPVDRVNGYEALQDVEDVVEELKWDEQVSDVYGA
jgi:hypothetical protein